MQPDPSAACECGWPEKECLRRVLGNGPPFPPKPCEPKAEASADARTENILGRISLYGKSLARRQIINDHLTEDFSVDSEGRRELELFDRIVKERGW